MPVFYLLDGFSLLACFPYTLFGMVSLILLDERSNEQAKSQQGISGKDAHLAGNIGHFKPIKDSKEETVEDCEGSRGHALANLTGILAQRDIAAPMKSIFNGPVVPDQFQESLGTGKLRREAREAIDPLLGVRERFADAATQTEHLSNAWPGFGKEVIEFGRCHDFSDFQPSMTALAGVSRAPVVAINRWFAEKTSVNRLSRWAVCQKQTADSPLLKRRCWRRPTHGYEGRQQ